MANIITGIRIVLSIVLLFFSTFSPVFCALYLTAGLTDMIDGAAARKTGTESEFGAKLDTIADVVFVAVCLIKLLPILRPPVWLLVWTGLIALIKAINVVLFALPLTVSWIGLEYPAAVVCAVATFAAVQEGHLIRTGRD